MLIPEKYRELSDPELLVKYQTTGDKLFVGVLYQKYAKLVFGLCMKYLKDEDEAQDLTIIIFTKLFDNLLKHEVTYFKSWLYTFSKNECLMKIRSQKKESEKLKIYEQEIKVFMENGEEMHHKANKREETYAALEKAIDHLNLEQKTCIKLFYIENKSYQQIADISGYSISNIKSYIQNGKRNLKIRLENKDGKQNE